MQNDMSVILGDLTFFIDKTIYRKSLMDQTLNDRSDLLRHEMYGGILTNHVSIDDMVTCKK
jgi:hypothetical protein